MRQLNSVKPSLSYLLTAFLLPAGMVLKLTLHLAVLMSISTQRRKLKNRERNGFLRASAQHHKQSKDPRHHFAIYRLTEKARSLICAFVPANFADDVGLN
ncbi:hypothetical protein QS306_11995 [Paraburkholderia bonniea]|uniref:hypothetical protein n=1 Tax=Paraburkholderia bonniea TaxID=2152891 RepID=UPI00257320ED|nr:hypothetical protein [Paraburkholderia bonniea]WJF89816.1 hypothetical protein QS306_11995 [Paraburkholderia bonniea]WJF93130.1 hypothetical protein QS308_12005 [Paraburkholderia bonniea]